MDITTLGLQDPTQTFQKWYGVTQPLRDMRAQQKQDALDQSKLAIMQQNADLERQKIEAAAKRQQDLDDAAQALNQNDTAANRLKWFTLQDQSTVDKSSAMLNSLDVETRTNKAMESGKVISLIKNGHPEMAWDALQAQADGYRAKGDEKEAQATEKMIEAGKVDPNFIVNHLGFTMSLFPEGQKVWDNLNARDKQANENSEQPFTNDLKASQAELARAQAELARNEAKWKSVNGTNLTQDQKINTETQMRKELETLAPVSTFLKKTTQYSNILNAGNDSFVNPEMGKEGVKYDGQGVADMNLIYSYIKMLDDGGAVMNGDYVAAEGASGMVQQAANLFNKIANGDKLTPAVRRQYLDEAKGIYESSKSLAQKSATSYEGIAKRSGLDPSNVNQINFDTPVRNASAKGAVVATTGTDGTTGITGKTGGATPAAPAAPQKKVKVKF